MPTNATELTDKRPLRIQQIPLVVAIMNELSDQGLTSFKPEDYKTIMTAIIDSADTIKHTIDTLQLERDDAPCN